MRLALTLAGLAIGFAVPAHAQEQNRVDPEVRQTFSTHLICSGSTAKTFKVHQSRNERQSCRSC
jgi:hypothetical protein